MTEGGMPDPWKMIFDQLNRIESNMLTRGEFSAHQQRFDHAIAEVRARVDEVQTRSLQTTAEWKAESIAEHKELEARIDRVEENVQIVEDKRHQAEKEQRKDKSSRWFAIALAGLAAVFTFLNNIIQGGIG